VSIGRFHLPRRRGIWDREYDKNNVSLRNELPSAGIVRVPQRQTQLRLHSWRSAASVYLGMPARTHAVRSESYRVRVRNEHHVAPRQYRRRFLPPIAAATLRPIATAPWNSPGGAFPLSRTFAGSLIVGSLSLSLSPDRSRTRESARYRTQDGIGGSGGVASGEIECSLNGMTPKRRVRARANVTHYPRRTRGEWRKSSKDTASAVKAALNVARRFVVTLQR